jgi:nucleoside-diphosphate-sugar epimerase
MRVFLTGATGYVGSAVLDALFRGGHQVVALARDPETVERLKGRGAIAILGELSTPKRFVSEVAACDAAIHTAFEASPRAIERDRQAIDMLVSALGGSASSRKAFIYTSGVWVLGKNSRPADEDSPVNPAEHVAWRPTHEQAVLDAATNGLRTIVVRPGILYGGSRGIISELLKDALNGLVRVVGNGKNHWPCVYYRDVGDLYARLVQSPDASGIFHANDEADERVNDIVEAIAAHLLQTPDIRHVPLPEAKKKMGTYADALAMDQRVRSPRARALGWSPSLTCVSANVPRLFEEFRNTRRVA